MLPFTANLRKHRFPSCILLGMLLGPLASGAYAQEAMPTPTPEPEKVITVVEERRPGMERGRQRVGNGAVTVSKTTIARNPAVPLLNNLITATVPGAAALPNGAIRIRGSDNQFSYFLDGAPLPSNVSAFITDQFNPKNIESLRVLTGAFPAQFGGQLSAIFDLQSKGGQPGVASGFLQGEAGNFGSRNGTFQYSGGASKMGFFLSGLGSRTDFRLSPISSEALHNGGRESVGFGKFDYRLGERDLLTLDLGTQNAHLEVPNSPDRDAVGQDDLQLEDKNYLNAIWRRSGERQSWTMSLYSHTAKNRYLGSAGDLIPSDDDEDDDGEDDVISSVNQRQRIRYTGVRGDYALQGRELARGVKHRLGAGFEMRRARGQLDFSLISAPDAGFEPLLDNRALKGSDLGVYLQDDWTKGKFNLNYGLRYDRHRAQGDGKSSQISPRLNFSYAAGRNTFYAFYNRLWMPVPVESIRRLAGESALGDVAQSRIRPETDDFYGLGWKKQAGQGTWTANAYYKSIRNIVDNQEVGDTLLEVPLNEARGIVRGVEFSYDRPITPNLSFSGSYGLSRGVASGPVMGGLLGLEDLPNGLFVDDHDQTHVASASLTYSKHRTYGILNGQFESGLPFGETTDANGDLLSVNDRRSPSHLIFNGGIGHQFKNGLELAANVTNILDKEYIIAADNVFRRSIYGQRRAFALRATFNF